jgi:hypothetical protein
VRQGGADILILPQAGKELLRLFEKIFELCNIFIVDQLVCVRDWSMCYTRKRGGEREGERKREKERKREGDEA